MGGGGGCRGKEILNCSLPIPFSYGGKGFIGSSDMWFEPDYFKNHYIDHCNVHMNILLCNTAQYKIYILLLLLFILATSKCSFIPSSGFSKF